MRFVRGHVFMYIYAVWFSSVPLPLERTLSAGAKYMIIRVYIITVRYSSEVLPPRYWTGRHTRHAYECAEAFSRFVFRSCARACTYIINAKKTSRELVSHANICASACAYRILLRNDSDEERPARKHNKRIYIYSGRFRRRESIVITIEISLLNKNARASEITIPVPVKYG